VLRLVYITNIEDAKAENRSVLIALCLCAFVFIAFNKKTKL